MLQGILNSVLTFRPLRVPYFLWKLIWLPYTIKPEPGPCWLISNFSEVSMRINLGLVKHSFGGHLNPTVESWKLCILLDWAGKWLLHSMCTVLVIGNCECAIWWQSWSPYEYPIFFLTRKFVSVEAGCGLLIIEGNTLHVLKALYFFLSPFTNPELCQIWFRVSSKQTWSLLLSFICLFLVHYLNERTSIYKYNHVTYLCPNKKGCIIKMVDCTFLKGRECTHIVLCCHKKGTAFLAPSKLTEVLRACENACHNTFV